VVKEDYLKFSHLVRKDLVTLFEVLKSLCYISLRRCLETELEYKMIIEDNQHDVTVLCNLIRKVCSGSISVIIDDIIGTILEALYNYLLNRAKDHELLPKYLEASDHKFEILKSTRFTFATPEI